MQNDIVKRPPSDIVDRSIDKNIEKTEVKADAANTPKQPPANIDVVTAQKSSPEDNAANNLVNKNTKQSEKSEKVGKKKHEDKPQETAPISPKKSSNTPIVPITLAIIVCIALIALVVMSQLKIIS